MSAKNDFPSGETVNTILSHVIPDYRSFNIHALKGSYSNHTHLVKVKRNNGENQHIVLRRYNVDNGDMLGKAQREFKALEYLQDSGIPVPKPLLLDDTGHFFGSPGIVTEFIVGEQINAATSPTQWVANIDVIAQTLAQIHAIPIKEDLKPVLMNGNVEAAWFIKEGDIPKYMKEHPDGAMVWHTVSDLLSRTHTLTPAFIHIDYWSGNILWHEGKLSAIVDWEEAGFGDPAIDVAYCRMELYLEGLDDAADRFLHVYEESSGKPVTNLGLWELAAAARPMTKLEDWLTRPHMDERFSKFIATAKQKLS